MLSDRNCEVCSVDVGTSVGNSTPFSFSNHASGMILVPSTEATPTLEFYTSDTEGGTYRRIFPHGSTSAVSVSVAASIAKEIPPQIFGAHWVKIVASAISSGTSIKYTLLLKS